MYVVDEGRDILRWKLNLSTAQIQALLERVWTLSETAAYPYFFLQQNCATLLVDLINSILPHEKAANHSGVAGRSPAQALDALYYVKTASGQPLLEYIPSRMLSMRSASVKSNSALKDIELELAQQLESGDKDLFLLAQHPDEAIRSGAYRRMATALGTVMKTHPLLVSQYFLHRGIIESYWNAKDNLAHEEKLRDETFRELDKIEKELPELIEKRSQEHARALLPTQARLLVSNIAHIIGSLETTDAGARHAGYASIVEYARQAPPSQRDLVDHLRCLALLRAVANSDNLKITHEALFEELFLVEPTVTLSRQRYLQSYRELLDNRHSTVISPAILALQRTKEELLSH
ncbi:uncharacterized protein METZ01_LOCUS262120, partial [marine metagenome]